MKYALLVVVIAVISGCRPDDPFPAQESMVTPAGAVFEFEDAHPNKEYYLRVSDDAAHALTSEGIATPEEVKSIFARVVFFVRKDESYFECSGNSGLMTNGCTSEDGTVTRLSVTAAPISHEMLHVLSVIRGVPDSDNHDHKDWGTMNASMPAVQVKAGHYELLRSWYNVTDIAAARWTYIYQNHIDIPPGRWIGAAATVP